MGHFILFDALIAWRNEVLHKNLLRKSKVEYLSNMSKLIEWKIVDLKQPVSEFVKHRHLDSLEAIANASAWTPWTKKCRKDLFLSFYRFVQNCDLKTDLTALSNQCKNFEMSAISELLSSNEIKAQSEMLTKDDILRFLDELSDINVRDTLVCWMAWEFKATILQILDLKIRDIDFENWAIRINVAVMSPSSGISQGLKRCILIQSKGLSSWEHLFSTAQGCPIHSGQIVRNMKKASIRAKLPITLSPKILYAHSKAYSKKVIDELSNEERKNLSLEYIRKLKNMTEKVKGPNCEISDFQFKVEFK